MAALTTNAGGWVLLVALALIVVYEVFAVVTHSPTISQWVRRHARTHAWWWTVLGMIVIGLTLFHLFFGGPL